MTNASDNANAPAGRAARSGNLFVRLRDDGDSAVGAFVGAPVARDVHWVDGRPVECTGPGCGQCLAGNRCSHRVALNFFVPAEGAMKVIEGGTVFFAAVLAARDKYGFEGWLFEVTRIGKAGDRSTRHTIVPQRPIDEAVAASLRGAHRHNLAALGRPRE
jgi:hypothetical protein